MHASSGGNIVSGSTAVAAEEPRVKAPLKIPALKIPMREIPRRNVPKRDIKSA
jgi:hypothetical protein